MRCLIHPKEPIVGPCTQCKRTVCETCRASKPDKPLVCNICHRKQRNIKMKVGLIGYTILLVILFYWLPHGDSLISLLYQAFLVIVLPILIVIATPNYFGPRVNIGAETKKRVAQFGSPERSSVWYADSIGLIQLIFNIGVVIIIYILDTSNTTNCLVLFSSIVLIWTITDILYSGAVHDYIKYGNYNEAKRHIQFWLKFTLYKSYFIPMQIMFHHQQGQLKEAERVARRVVNLIPNKADSYTNLGGVFADSGQYLEAEAACQAAFALSPASPTALNSLAYTLVQSGKELERAIALLQIAIELDDRKKNRPIILNTLAQAYFKQNDIPSALEKANESLQLTDQVDRYRLSVAHYWLGILHQADRQEAQANEHLRQAITMDQHGWYAQQAQQALQ